jgi:hypothetical protein
MVQLHIYRRIMQLKQQASVQPWSKTSLTIRLLLLHLLQVGPGTQLSGAWHSTGAFGLVKGRCQASSLAQPCGFAAMTCPLNCFAPFSNQQPWAKRLAQPSCGICCQTCLPIRPPPHHLKVALSYLWQQAQCVGGAMLPNPPAVPRVPPGTNMCLLAAQTPGQCRAMDSELAMTFASS